MPLCGHGTAAAANVLFTLHPQAIRVHLQTRERGQLAATLEGTANGDKAVLVGLDLPIAPPREVDAAEHADIAAAVCGIAWFAPEHIVRIATFGDRSVIVQVDERVRIGELAVDASKFVSAASYVASGVRLLADLTRAAAKVPPPRRRHAAPAPARRHGDGDRSGRARRMPRVCACPRRRRGSSGESHGSVS